MNVLQVGALLIYTFGTYAYGALLVLWWRDLRHEVRPFEPSQEPSTYQSVAVSGAMFAVSFLWFVTNLLMVLQQLAPGPEGGPLWLACLWTGVWLAFAFPPLITHMVWAEARERRSTLPPNPWGSAVALTYGVAGAFALGTTLGFANLAGIPRTVAERLVSAGTISLFVWAAVYSVALLSRYPAAPRTRRDAQSTRWHIVLFGFMALLFVFVFALDRQSSAAALLGGSLEIVAKSLPIAFMFVGTYFEHRFEFFDLFVKRGFSLFVTLGLLAVAFTIGLPVLHRYDSTWAAPWAYAVILLPLAMALPWLHARISAALDRRWLGRRFTTVEAVKHFLAGLKSATTEEQLIERAETGLSGIFDAPAAVRLATAPPAAARGFASVEEVAIRSADGVAGRFLLGSRRSEAPYFSEDVALLESLSDVFASVLSNLRLQLRQQEQDRRARDLSLHASQSELKALRAQINPHFLFNALNSIAGLIHRDPAVADRTIEKLADVFRYTLRGAEAEWTVLEDELDFVRAYLDVEQARFGTRLQTEVHVGPDAGGARVPTMVIQTLVDNAVKHGAATVRGQAVVRVAATRDGNQLRIAVEDNGPGFPAPDAGVTADMRRRGGHGLASIRRRLDGYFADTAALQVVRDEGRGRTVVSLTMPFVAYESRAHPAPGAELQR